MTVTAGGMIHVTIGAFPYGFWYLTRERRGVFSEGFDTPQSVIANARKHGVNASDAVHAEIMAAVTHSERTFHASPELKAFEAAVKDPLGRD